MIQDNQFNLTAFFLERLRTKVSAEKCIFQTSNNTVSLKLLENSVKKLSSQLIKYVSKNDSVILLLNDSPDLIFSFLSIIAVGGIPICLNPKLSNERISHILSNSASKVIVCENDLTEELTESFNEVTILQRGKSKNDKCFSVSQLIANGNNSWQEYCFKSADDLCVLQYTSGSTGVPKGVMHSAMGILSFCEIFAGNHLRISPQDILYSAPKIFFGYGMGNSLFFPLYCGATAILDEKWPQVDFILENLKMFSPSIFFAVPTLLRALLKADLKIEVLRNLRVLFSAGSPLTPTLYDKVAQKWGKYVVDGVGATELGHVFLTNDINNPLAISGAPLPGYQVEFVKNLQAASKKVKEGELFVKGPSVAMGYLNNDKETSLKFCNGGYHTGDVFRQLDDGNYEYLGRTDDHFKSKGQWVIPIVLENLVLEEFEYLSEVALVGSYIDGEVTPTLYVTLSSQELNEDQIRAQLKAFFKNNFDSHCRPQKIIFMNKFPKNENGKLKRKELELNFLEKVPQ
tara:strand:- start:10398 stop:11942 length:1545 start_codon:yes stop_codon:yes gene_type:complete